MFRLFLLVWGLTVTACVAADEPPREAVYETSLLQVKTERAWVFDDHVDALRAQSCPEGAAFIRPDALTIEADPIDIGDDQQLSERITGMDLVGAWHLTADDKNFGGLSALAGMRSGALLAISDAGAWISIGIDAESGAPDGYGSIGYMRGANGRLFGSKMDGDSEGLALRDGLALVSFEQDHRIEAFDLEGCGVGARAARVVDLPPVVGGQKVPDNRGAEALALTATGGLNVGFEMANLKGSPHALVMVSGDLAETSRLQQPGFYLLTDIDHSEDLTAQVMRAYDPIRGSRVQVTVSSAVSGDRVAFADLKSPLLVDNFEGVAFARTGEGKTRLWLVADDNFSPTQRSLLLAFELD